MKRRGKSKSKSMDSTNSTRKRPQAKKQSFLAQMIGFRPPIAVVALIVMAVIASVYYVFTTQAATAWPLKASTNNRYLVDQNNKPFLYTADTAWSLLTSLSVADAKRVIDMRKAQGFNAIQTNIVFPARTTSGPHGAPFQGDDLTKPNEAYFVAVDEIVRYAQTQDMALLMGTLWIADNGGRVTGRLPSNAEMQSYGTYLGNRYKTAGNIMWFVGGDDQPYTAMDQLRVLANALKASDPNHLITYHSWGKGFDVSGESWLGFNAFQWNSNSPPYPYQDVTEGYAYGKPVLNMEPAYDPNACCGDDKDTSLQENRRSGWWSILSGAMGVAYGGPREAWNVGAESGGSVNTGAINRPGATHTGNIRKILEPYGWEKLVPDNNNGVVIGDRGNRGGPDYVTAGRASDGSLIAAYTPNSRTLIVNMSQLAGPAQGYWVDPTNGTKTSIGANLPNSGNQSFTSPGQNAGGDSDFVLILSTGAQSPTSPSVPTTVPTVLPTVALVTPTLVCLGSCPTLAPSGATPGNPVPTSSTVTPTGQVPTNDPSQPEPTIGGDPTVTPQPGGGGGNQQPQGIIGWFLALLALIIQFFLSLFGR